MAREFKVADMIAVSASNRETGKHQEKNGLDLFLKDSLYHSYSSLLHRFLYLVLLSVSSSSVYAHVLNFNLD